MMKIAAICETHFVGVVGRITGPIATAALVNSPGTFPDMSNLTQIMEVTRYHTHRAQTYFRPDGSITNW